MESTKRRKDLYQALTGNMADLFSWQLLLLKSHYEKYTQAKEAQDEVAIMQHSSLVEVRNFVSYIGTSYILQESRIHISLVLFVLFLLYCSLWMSILDCLALYE